MVGLVAWCLVALAALGRAGPPNCPSVCLCKWKGGKRTVECTDRALITVPDGIDQETQVLDASGNNLQILPRENFVRVGLLNLQRLYLRSCRLGQIDDRALRGLKNLVEMDLSHNLLTYVPSATFQDVPFLRDLNLAHNPIQKIEGHAFRTVPGLIKLDLSDCALRSVASKAFEGVELLESLKLNGNRLQALRPQTVETLSKLHGVELHDNPWYCDCNLRAAKIWLTDYNIPYPVAPLCAGGPERLAHKSFADLDLDDFACKPEIRPDSRLVEAVAGDNMTIMCRVQSVPEATVNWYWNSRLLLNNSAFSSFQKIYVSEAGAFDKRSTLILTNVQESDSGDFYCIAENRAGNSEANYTVHVAYRMAGMVTLGSGQIAGLSAALVILILFILLVVSVLLVKLRRSPFEESKTPGQGEVVANGSAPKAVTPTAETGGFQERKEPVAVRTPDAAEPADPDLINDTREEPGEYRRVSDSGLYPNWDEARPESCGDRTPIVALEGYPADYGLPLPGPSPPPSARTLRVWQRGVPVLPPVSALKRVLVRSSPDEGYQEGTDV